MKPAWLNPKTLFLAAAIGTGIFAFLDRLYFPDASRNFLGETKHAELSANGPITQVFQASQDGLEGLQIFMGDTDLGLGERIDFTLLDPSCHKVFARANRTMFSLPATRDIRFAFPAFSASAGESYCLSIEYRPGFIKKKERPYIRVSEDTSFETTSYTDHGKGKSYSGRTLQIRPLYAPGGGSIPDRFAALENRLSQYKPAFAKGMMLLIGGSGILFGIVFFVWISRRKE